MPPLYLLKQIKIALKNKKAITALLGCLDQNFACLHLAYQFTCGLNRKTAGFSGSFYSERWLLEEVL